jgi:SPP1 family holin
MDKGTVVRMAGLVIVLLNALLALFNVPFLIPAESADAVAAITIVGYSLYMAVKDNFFGKKGKVKKEVLEQKGLKK